MKKQGFTLIELMVVIVIMGILAAVAVPKLFGMIAKSKASEVGPAAGTYVKLQSAYFSESNVYGTWKEIGYVGPGSSTGLNSTETTNFSYSGAITEKTNAAEIGWKATNNSKLNDCALGSIWKVTTTAISAGADTDSYTAETACAELTPTFEKIGK